MDLGYSIVAYTDHEILIPHNDLTDENFLALNGVEIGVVERNKPADQIKSCHCCFIALDKDNDIQPMWNEKDLWGNAPNYKDLVKYDKTLPPYIRTYSVEKLNEMMQIARNSGFFVTYNHPTWSLESYPEYANYTGMHAFEMFNGNGIALGYEEYNPRVYDDILRTGKRIFCIGADDNHNDHEGTRRWYSGVAFTFIKAEKLEYKTITDALLQGNFYCSEGPEIFELWIENNQIHIKCSEADRIVCSYQVRKADIVYAEKGVPVTSANFDIGQNDGYVRITVIDKNGKHACTNAYFIDCQEK